MPISPIGAGYGHVNAFEAKEARLRFFVSRARFF